MNDGVQHQTLRIYQEMALLAFDLLASVEAVGIDAALPCILPLPAQAKPAKLIGGWEPAAPKGE